MRTIVAVNLLVTFALSFGCGIALWKAWENERAMKEFDAMFATRLKGYMRAIDDAVVSSIQRSYPEFEIDSFDERLRHSQTSP